LLSDVRKARCTSTLYKCAYVFKSIVCVLLRVVVAEPARRWGWAQAGWWVGDPVRNPSIVVVTTLLLETKAHRGERIGDEKRERRQ
jgi:hypothetical protein